MLINLYFQPHLFIVEYPYDLISYREQIIKKELNYYLTHPLPLLQQTEIHRFVIFRNQKNNIAWKKICHAEFLLIQQFKNGLNLQNACDWINKQDADTQDVMSNNFQNWMQNWVRLGWLYLKE